MPFNLLTTTSRVETAFIKVQIGDYCFGVYDKQIGTETLYQETIRVQKIKYPNYIQSLNITKINGQVNQYTLKLSYPITEKDDPNFFEKVFSSVSESRSIIFSYGDLNIPTYCYRNEKAMITKITSSFNPNSSVIDYTVKATSSGSLAVAGTYSFPKQNTKPSDVIKKLLFNKAYGLQEIFTGMKNRTYVEANLIPSDDKKVEIQMKTNISILDYISYLVSCMTPLNSSSSNLIKGSVYVLTIVDDTSGNENLQGTYFKIVRSDNKIAESDAYVIDFGYPSSNIVTDFKVENDETYSIYYEYQEQLNDSSYAQRIDDAGNVYDVYAPIISSGTDQYKTTEQERAWWTKATSYPIKASITLKGLLRPAILMTHVRLNVLFYGKKHINSGLYIITKQEDQVNASGFRTTLNLVRVGEDEDFDFVA